MSSYDQSSTLGQAPSENGQPKSYPTQPAWATEASGAPHYAEPPPAYTNVHSQPPYNPEPFPTYTPLQTAPATTSVVSPGKNSTVCRSVGIVLLVLVCIGIGVGILLWRVLPSSIINSSNSNSGLGCSSSQFRCSDGKCIQGTWKCDGESDCSRGEDESSSMCGAIVAYPPLTGPIFFNTTKPCDSESRFQCINKDGGCIPNSWVCDGRNDCGDNSDETGCLCDPATQFYCGSSKCVSKSKVCDNRNDCPYDSTLKIYRDEYLCSSYCGYSNFRCKTYQQCLLTSWTCDGVNDCFDGSDETGCKCSVFQASCNDGACIDISKWCDGFRDCRDSSDEIAECHKVCPNGGKRCQSNGVCVNRPLLCDRINDCLDGTDEKDCPGGCTSDEFQCNDKKCIDKNWMCDGNKDCSNGEDELLASCKKCSASQFQCVSGSTSCVSSMQRCDGTAQCTDSSDEAQCLLNGADGAANPGDFTKPLNVTLRGQTDNYICADGWSKSWSDVVCRQMGFGDSATTSTNLAVPGTGRVVTLNPATYTESSGILRALIDSGSCSSNNVIGISCQALECGVRGVSSNTTGPYIINGQEAVRGAWPWQTFLQVTLSNGRGTCGGSLINDRWVLTAAHCVTPSVLPGAVTVQAGSIYIYNEKDPESKTLPVDRVIVHPGYTDSKTRNVIINDVALLRLRQPVTFSETIRPICIAQADVDLNKFKVCVATGFGRIRSDKLGIPTTLRQGKLKLMTTDECYAAYRTLTNGATWTAARSDFNYFVCAGNNPPFRGVDVCQGDSGGPLACQDQQNVWSLVGVTSFVFDECQMSVFARVSTFNAWITTVMSIEA